MTRSDLTVKAVKMETDSLDSAQREAVEATEARLLISAGPGSGKTRVLVARLTRLVGEGGEGFGTLCLSFTNKAARVMKERAGAVVAKDNRVFIGTFHSFCLSVLHRERPELVLINRARQKRLLKEAGIKDVRVALKQIGFYKSNQYSLNSPAPDVSVIELVNLYNKRLSHSGLMDLDDLILLTITLFEQDPLLLKRYQERHGHVMVDEFQDINPPQARLVRILSAGTRGSLFCIGDMDQTIYGFRGANLAGFSGFTRDWPGARVIGLDTNYRSRSRIVEASRAVIEGKSSGKGIGLGELEGLQDGRGIKAVTPGGEVTRVECADERGEALFVVQEIERLMGALTSLSSARDGANDDARDLGFSDFAVLYRTNRQAKALEECFSRANIPYQVLGRMPEAELDEFIDSFEALELAGLGLLGPIVEEEAVRVGLDSSMKARLVEMASGLECTEEGRSIFVDRFSLMTPEELTDIVIDRVTLLTLHMSKGLEFKVVFIAGCEEGLIPLSLKDGIDMEEERRLLYVGMTRAIDALYLLNAKERRVYGECVKPKRSSFVSAIAERLVDSKTIKKKLRKRRPVQKGLFD